ncbi:MAG: hypothetical protein ACREB8_06530 [Pseudolabrys sp.]
MKPKLIFHIGLEKTGTDSFQRFCTDNRRLLRQYSVLYPGKSLAFARYSHAPLVACYLPYRDLSIHMRRRARPAVLASLFREIDRNTCDTVLLSAEHFSSRFREPEIERLAADFAGYDCRIAVVVRAHAPRICSAYAQSILAGRHLTVDEYCDEILTPDHRYIRYRETISAWERVFGTDKMCVFAYEAGPNIVETLRRNLVSAAIPVGNAANYWDNKSYDARATEALRLVNLALWRGGPMLAFGNRMRWASAGFVRWRARRLLERTGEDRTGDPVRLGTHNLQRFMEIAEADCRWLRQNYAIRLPPPDMASEPATPDLAAQYKSGESLAKALIGQIPSLRLLMRLNAMRRP